MRIDDKPQEGQHILDLLPPEELDLIKQHKGQPFLLGQMAAEIAKVQGEVLVVTVAARQDADAAIVRDGQLLDLVVDPLRFFGKTHGALEDDGQS